MPRAVLLLLVATEPEHGYALFERLGGLGLQPKWPSTLYRELRELEAGGLITSSWRASQTRGPARRVYRVTRAGRRELEATMGEVALVARRLGEAIERYDTLSAERKGRGGRKSPRE
ncbi:MAG: PadR family transcriptional regulator [Actinomycetota bacterium]|nr:PadR family transcriptional regulator [Actinomycetota bacterium]